MSRTDENLLEKQPCFPDLRGQVALITGGGTGIGRGVALRLAAEGMKVAICGRRPENLAETVKLVEERGGEIVARPADVGQPGDVRAVIETVVNRFGPIDALVHNAMLMNFSPFEQHTLDLWEASFATGCRAAYMLAEHVVPGMRERGRGSIIFVTSVLATRSGKGGLAYHAVKGAQEAMTRHMAVTWAADGIRVNALAPGLILTWREITSASLANQHVPLGRAGTPAEMAAVVAFLLSQQSSYITGQVIHADGGTSVQLAPPSIRL